MDWSKAKNILIMAFIVTNIFLAYELFNMDKQEEKTLVEDEVIGEVKALLMNEDIKVASKIPSDVPSLSSVSLEYESYDVDSMSEKILGNFNEEYIVGVKKYTNGEKLVEFFNNNKKIVYRDMALKSSLEKRPISKQDALDYAITFLGNIGLSLDDAKLSFYDEDELVHTFEYSKAVGDIPLEETCMRFEVSSEGVVMFERYWMKNVKEENRIITATSAPKALLRLLTREEYYGKTIVDIGICYYFDTDRYIESAGFKESTGGVAVPTWRFIFSDGEKVFLEEN